MNTIQITTHFDDAPADPAQLEALIQAVCDRFGLAGATVSVGIVDDAEIAELNQKYLNHEGPTDCLSFDLSEDQAAGSRVFDLIVNGQMAVRQAAQRGHAPQAELALYVTHGLLHQLGYDDDTPEKARKMHQTEDEILQHLGYGLVYNDNPR
ncbi:MAG: rRNA maturation RNase YbeY [Anaerolineae bacterium]